MQLGYDNPLSTVDHKGTIVSHEWNFTHVDFLLFDIFNCSGWCIFIKRHQT